MTPRRGPAAIAVLGIPALAYGGAVRLRNRFYDRQALVRRAPIAVVSVGNLTVGGTGKTPLVAWLVRSLEAQGRRPAVVSRGYGGDAGRGPRIVSSGDGPRMGPDRCGDEPFLLARSLPGVPVIVGADRLAGAIVASEIGADVVVLDDGFQHRRLARAFDLVLVDASNPFGNYRLLPAGILREPIAGVSRADAVLITRSRPGESLMVIERVVRRFNPRAPILRAAHRRVGFVDREGKAVSIPRRVVAFCGIGSPATFADDLEREGLDLVALRVFGDHHRYSDDDLRGLSDAARNVGAVLVTTEKDMARLSGDRPLALEVPLAALRIEAEVHDADALRNLVRSALAAWSP